MKTRLVRLAALVAILAGTMTLVGPAWAATKNVKLTADNKFQPGTLSVEVGDSVQFTWEGGFHDVKFADGASSGSPVGDVGTTYTRNFDAAGSFAYICTVHEALGMTGTIAVLAAGDGGSGSLPLTGPEDSVLPLAGVALAVGGLVVLLRLRRSSG